MSGGRLRRASEMAVCTSCAAASMLRSSENCSVICVMPLALEEVICSSPAMAENSFSSGVATAEAMVSGLAPGSAAETWMVGKVDVGQLRHRQLPVGQDAEGQNADHDQDRHDRTADEDLGDVHRLASPG